MSIEKKELSFGNFYYDNSEKKKELEWIVLKEENEKILLLCKYIIDAKAYDNPDMPDLLKRFEPGTFEDHAYWSECTLREWLNHEFLQIAFNTEERKQILPSQIVTHNSKRIRINPYDSSTEVKGGPNSLDFIFCLSTDEVEKYFEVTRNIPASQINPALNGRVDSNAIREIKGIETTGTPYANNKNLYYSDNAETPWWWLRSPGGSKSMAAIIQSGNILYKPGEKVDDETIGVRPALWIKKTNCYKSEKAVQQDSKAVKNSVGKNNENYNQNNWKEQGKCQYCGGEFKGFFTKKCSKCGKKKDY